MAFYNELSKYGDRAALIGEEGTTITYQELENLSNDFGKIIPERELVFVLCRNIPGSVGGYLSFLAKDIVPLLLSAEINKDLLENLLSIYQPSYLYVPEQMSQEFDKAKLLYKKYGYCLLYIDSREEVKLYPDLALLLTTSGSTGSPKLVRQSYTNIQANAESIASYLHLDERERPITTLPMNYTYGLSIINSHILVGATILMTEQTLVNRNFWNFFREQEATSFGGVPYTYEILKKLKFFHMELPSLRTFTQAGGKLPPSLHQEFAEYAEETNKNFVVMYGQTEATARMGYLPPEYALEKKGSMGIAIPGGKLWLKDIEGNEITEADKVGELVYEGKNVTLGYAESREDLQKGDERNGILETGDMAKRDKDGFFYIVGRKKRFLKIYGNRVNLDETERMVQTEYLDMDCACAGMDDKLYVFITNQSEERREEVQHFLSNKTGLNPIAFYVKSISEIPKSDAGKTLYIKLEEYYD